MENGHRLTISGLRSLPDGAVLMDVRAYCRLDDTWASWTRWPRATPAEIIEDMRFQRRFAPVLTWRCREIRVPTPPTGVIVSVHQLALGMFRRLAVAGIEGSAAA